MKCLKQINQLRRAITSGQVGPGDRVGTEFAFSQEWGLARNTVRRGIETLVREGLLERRPGKGLYVRTVQSAVRTIQVILPSLAWPHLVRITQGIQAAGRKYSVQTLVYDAHGQMDLDLEVIRQLPHGSIDGAIIISLHHRQFSEVLFGLKSAGYPFVLVDQRLHDLEVPTVEIDNYGGGYMVGQQLAALGHRRVAFLGPLNLHIITERLNGFRDALLDAGVLFDRSLVLDLGGEGVTEWMNEKSKATEDALLPLLTREGRPTAVFDGSGDVAPLIYRAARRAELEIPRDLSVVTFDDAPFGGYLEPEVARLGQCWTQMGDLALEMLVEQMNNASRGTSKVYEHHMVTTTWVPGKSVAPPAVDANLQ